MGVPGVVVFVGEGPIVAVGGVPDGDGVGLSVGLAVLVGRGVIVLTGEGVGAQRPMRSKRAWLSAVSSSCWQAYGVGAVATIA